mgnify:FL=1|tara:strand:+ start:14602 stop:14892 length:291 start_codon:yes stop_codon:yes gene_type:complete
MDNIELTAQNNLIKTLTTIQEIQENHVPSYKIYNTELGFSEQFVELKRIALMNYYNASTADILESCSFITELRQQFNLEPKNRIFSNTPFSSCQDQ